MVPMAFHFCELEMQAVGWKLRVRGVWRSLQSKAGPVSLEKKASFKCSVGLTGFELVLKHRSLCEAHCCPSGSSGSTD